jgi:hydrogenase expression/formation protein HypC
MTLGHKQGTVCLAIPGKILEIDKKSNHALVDYGDGTKRRANISLVDVKVGDYVIVHAGFAIQILDEQEAQETLALFREMLSQDEGS